MKHKRTRKLTRKLARKLTEPTGKPCVMVEKRYFGSKVTIKENASTGGQPVTPWYEPYWREKERADTQRFSL